LLYGIDPCIAVECPEEEWPEVEAEESFTSLFGRGVYGWLDVNGVRKASTLEPMNSENGVMTCDRGRAATSFGRRFLRQRQKKAAATMSMKSAAPPTAAPMITAVCVDPVDGVDEPDGLELETAGEMSI